jgi:hypothetical protein
MPKNSLIVSTALAGDLRHVLGRLDAEDGDARVEVGAQEVAVVARDLDDEAAGAEPTLRDDALRERPAVLDEGLRVRREVQVLLEQLLGRDRDRDLRGRALRAHDHVERVLRLGTLEVLGMDERVRQGLVAEREHRLEALGAAGAAGREGASHPGQCRTRPRASLRRGRLV